jgi:hypothetical protein
LYSGTLLINGSAGTNFIEIDYGNLVGSTSAQVHGQKSSVSMVFDDANIIFDLCSSDRIDGSHLWICLEK